MVISAVESTSIALLAQLSGLLDPLRAFSKTKPVWGTCAGAILLAQEVKDSKRGGQELLGCVSITIVRNGWGSQVQFCAVTCSLQNYLTIVCTGGIFRDWT